VSFRSRIVLATGAAVLVAILLASVAVYLLVRGELRSQVDSQLEEFAGGVFAVRIETSPAGEGGGTRKDVIVGPAEKTKLRKFMLEKAPLAGEARGPDGAVKGVELGVPRDPLGGRLGFAQVVNSKGRVLGPSLKGLRLPVTPQTIAVARGETGPYFSDAEVNGAHARVYTRPVGNGRAVQAARSLSEVDDTLSRLTLILVAICAAGVGLAIGLGLLVGRTALRPVARLTAAAEHVARTRDLSRRIETGNRRDELASLARSFNTMLAALERSLAAQRQLVADASHELRTPLTSLRTNVEVLAEGERLAADERERLLADVVAQLEELTGLVADLVDLAREEEQPAAPEDVRFDQLVAGAVTRAGRHWPELEFRAELEPALVHADPSRLDRAVANLLANAAQWSPAGGPVEVELSAGELRVRDWGPRLRRRGGRARLRPLLPLAGSTRAAGLGAGAGDRPPGRRDPRRQRRRRQRARRRGAGADAAAGARGAGAAGGGRFKRLLGASQLFLSRDRLDENGQPKGAEMKRRDWAVAVGLALCAATLAACGSSGGEGGEASAAEQDEARLEFAECMRSHGVDMPDPQPGQAGVVMGATKAPGGKTTGVDPADPTTKKALAACEDKLGDLGKEMSPEQEEEFKEQALAFSQCMREHGIDMPDPEFSGDGKVKMRIGSDSGPSPESPAFQQAEEECGSKGPGGKGGLMFGAPPK
jgi:two-component system, OmpR family, sensor histidine kinase MprB